MATAPIDRTTGTVELGPKARALLRRIAALLEQLVDTEMPDPGKNSESDAEDA